MGVFLVALGLSLGSFPAGAQAAVFTVDDTADAHDQVPGDGSCNNGVNECTLRAAVEESNALAGPDAVSLPAGDYGLLVSSDGVIPITGDLTITGNSARDTFIRQETDLNGDGLDRVFDIGPATNVTIANVTVADGRALDASGFFGGNIRSAGTLTISQSTITGGRASSGGGISNVGGTLNVLDSTISGNSAPDGGGDSGAIQNFEPSDGQAPTLLVDRSTISGNTANKASGIMSWGNASSGGSITIRNSTIANNTSAASGLGAGLHVSSNATASFENSIIAGNVDGASPSNCGADLGASIVSNGYNLESVDECGFQTEGDIQAADPLLGGSPENNGGGTDTHSISTDSPAKDAGSCPPLVATGAATSVQLSSATLTGNVTPPADQRGVIRPQDLGCDMGAFELDGASVAPTSYSFDYGTHREYGNQTPLASLGPLTSTQTVGAGVGGLTPSTQYHYRLVAANGPVTVFGENGTFATPAALPPPLPPPPGPAKLADLPDPVPGVTTNVEPVSGTVLVALPPQAGAARTGTLAQKGRGFIPLTEARQIPIGSLLDTKRGRVRLQTARTRGGKRQSGQFFSGLFQVLQSRSRSAKGLTELRLKGSSFSTCKTPRRGRRATTRAQASASRRIRRLGSNARGRFRTRGRHSAATVRGTKWTTTDRCDGTLTTVQRGSVAVRDFRRKKTITVRAGKSYLAKARR